MLAIDQIDHPGPWKTLEGYLRFKLPKIAIGDTLNVRGLWVTREGQREYSALHLGREVRAREGDITTSIEALLASIKEGAGEKQEKAKPRRMPGYARKNRDRLMWDALKMSQQGETFKAIAYNLKIDPTTAGAWVRRAQAKVESGAKSPEMG